MGNYLVLSIIIVAILLSACQYTDAAGTVYYTDTVEAIEQQTRTLETMSYWEGAYAACMVHNMRVAAARGHDIESDEVFNFLDSICVGMADEILDMLGPDSWPFPAKVRPPACEGDCI